MPDARYGVLAAAAIVALIPAGAHAQLSSVTFVPGSVALPFNNVPTGQTRPVQLSPTGNPFALPPARPRTFVYNDVSASGASGTLFDGLTGFQWVQGPPFPNVNQARVDYWAPNQALNPSPGLFVYPDLAFRFRPFFLLGTCPVCGSDNAVSSLNSTATGVNVLVDGLVSNTITSSNNPITFGASGILGTLSFNASSTGAPGSITSTGSFSLTASEPPAPAPSAAQVPGPLPILGAATAFGFSRKLRRRIQLLKR